jgi:hypothetical protein
LRSQLLVYISMMSTSSKCRINDQKRIVIRRRRRRIVSTPLAAINWAADSAHAIRWLLVSKKTGFRGIYEERSPAPVRI